MASKNIIFYNSLGRVSEIRTREFSTSQMWLGDHSQITLNINIVPKIESNYYLPPCGERATITPLGNVVNYSTRIKPLFIP